MQDDAASLKSRLNDRLEDVLSHFWPGWVRKGKCAYPAAVSKDNCGSFEVYLEDGLRPRGRWFRNSEGVGGDEINLFAYGMTGQTKATSQVFKAIHRFLGDPVFRKRPPDRQKPERLRDVGDAHRNKHRAGQIWRACRPIIDGTQAETYLLARGIPRPPEGWPECFRFHPALQYPQGAQCPALVCRVDRSDGNPCAIWRIYLSPDGKGKAVVPNPKLGLGPAAGGAVRIGGTGSQVGIAEGIESSLGAWFLIGRTFPVWAGLSTSGVSGFEPPAGVVRVIAFPDGDRPMRRQAGEYVPSEPAGRAAARKLKERIDARAGIDCVITAEPPAGKDHLDLWVASQRSAA